MVEIVVSQPPEQPPDNERRLVLDKLTSKLSGEGDGQTSPSSSSPKLQCPRVPMKLIADGDNGDQGYYVPKRISLGPYHHCHPDLAGGETLKHKLAKAFVDEFDLSEEDLSDLIFNDVDDLRVCYEETGNNITDADFKVMMLVDGCALLWYIICVCLGLDHEDYDIRYQDLSLLHQDALLLENQLPYQLLQQLMKLVDQRSDLWTAIFQEFFGMIEDSYFQELLGMKEKPFLRRMKDYCCQLSLPVIRSIKGNPEPKREEGSQPKPEEKSKPKPEEESKSNPEEESKHYHHLLDLYHRNFLGDDERSNSTPREKIYSGEGSLKKDGTLVRDVKEQLMASFRNVKELMAAGIRIKPSPTPYLTDISFTSYGIIAYLRLPPITIDKSTKTIFFNLIAYEMSSDVPHDFISYLRFLDSLIDHADDVKELQSAGVLQNNLGTHEEVATFFNTVSAKLDSNFRAYKNVRVKIRKHLKSHSNSKLKMWMTQCLDTYFSGPWTIIAWIAAALALFLTAVQTYFSAFSR